ncbi:MAG TPA: hypothetical protein VGI16_10570 [Candidatus Acidoferrum sp.]
MAAALVCLISLGGAEASGARPPERFASRLTAKSEEFGRLSLAAGAANSVWEVFDYDVGAWRGSDVCGGVGVVDEGGFLCAAKNLGWDRDWEAKLVATSFAPDGKFVGDDGGSLAGKRARVRGADMQKTAMRVNVAGTNASVSANLGEPDPQSDVIEKRGVEWKSLLLDSTKFLLFQHAFRLATEPDTRERLGGPFLENYVNSVLSIHGWNDGDPFFVNYIDHPMEGGVVGFLFVAHDPQYRQATFGKSSVYWKSRLRAMAYSAAFSLQFEIGPVSEASIGHVQRWTMQNGVVDWVITPTVGFGWMIGEDALDKYVIERLEVRTQSHVARLLLRGVLNPTRSFSNMMQFKAPWHRDTRPGVREF